MQILLTFGCFLKIINIVTKFLLYFYRKYVILYIGTLKRQSIKVFSGKCLSFTTFERSTMSFEYIQKVPTPQEIQEEFPVAASLKEIKKERDKAIADVFTGKSDKFLVIVGPCSADNEEAVIDYVSRLAKVNDKVKDKLIIIPRIYTNKPRTTGEGYKGITSQPDPEGKPDFRQGLIAMRHMHIRAIEESGLTSADEMLYPENWGYVEDILSYVAIGARSVEDQQHRMTASGFDVPAGMKNPTSGYLTVMLNSIYAAQHPHSFL